jgi:cell division protein FtsN
VRTTSAESTRAMPSRPGAVATSPAQRPPARGATAYTIQIGAYGNRVDADARHRQLSAQGHAPRVVKVGALWRVRIGRYASRDAAAAAARSLKAKRIDAFVTEAESP